MTERFTPPRPSSFATSTGARPRTLVIFLPGAFSAASDFARQGFQAELESRAMPVRSMAIDLDISTFTRDAITKRLISDVIEPARIRGYQRIWLAGISMGALAAMVTAAQCPQVSGVIALSPYVGTRTHLRRVREAGGVEHWNPRLATEQTFWWESRLFGWLRERARQPGGASLIFAWGSEDRFAQSIALAAAPSAPSDRLVLPGGHDWPTWRALWRATLDRHADRIAPHSLAGAEAG